MSQNLKAFCIHDVKAEAYNQPFFAPAKGAAIRDFTDLVNDGKSITDLGFHLRLVNICHVIFNWIF